MVYCTKEDGQNLVRPECKKERRRRLELAPFSLSALCPLYYFGVDQKGTLKYMYIKSCENEFEQLHFTHSQSLALGGVQEIYRHDYALEFKL